ncbi:YfbU family protein [Massilia sp. DWR3-1-1]|uniref:YfbU family protein n=1 Tax=Massilia sp. DWR3-1-1 TaxID=2804559 RepID=UPI003CEAE53D
MAPKAERLELRMDEAQLSRIDDWAGEQAENLTRAEATRRLIDIGLSVKAKGAVDFSDGEKMLMLMMGDLYKKLEITHGEMNPQFLADVIYGGHYWAPKWEMNGVFHNHADSPQDVEHVTNVLDMWSFIEEAYEVLSPEQKAQIVQEVGPWAKDVKFRGFDGNQEGTQMAIASFLVEKMNRFQRFQGRSLNSHSSTLREYAAMYHQFEGIRPTLVGKRLDVTQLIELLKRS